jgi:hypothetical protein
MDLMEFDLLDLLDWIEIDTYALPRLLTLYFEGMWSIEFAYGST